MEKRSLRRYLNGKLAMRQSDRRHEQYSPVLDGDPIELVAAICVSRGSGSVALNNKKGVADVFNMSIRELDVASECGISASLAYLGMCVHVLRRARMAIDFDPIVYPWRHTLLPIISPLLRIAGREMHGKKGRNDAKFADKLFSHIGEASDGAEGEFLTYAKKVDAALTEHMQETRQIH